MDDWQCPRCTLINPNYVLKCDACSLKRPQQMPVFPNVSNIHPMQQTPTQTSGQYGWSRDICPVDERRIVFLGRTGSGKSASGNNILGKVVFESSVCGSSVTKKCQRGTGTRYGRNVQIIDSPGLFDTHMSNADITREVVKCVGMTAPGPHAFVLVVRTDRFTEEEQKTVDHFIKVFGEGMLNYLLVLFTKKDDLLYEGKTLQDYLELVPEDLKNLLQACHGRCIAFNNRGSETEREQDVQEFLNMIDQILQQNGGHCYTSEMFEEAERNMRQREEQLRQEHEMKRQKERAEIWKAFERKMKSKNKQHEYEAMQFQERIKQLEEEKKNIQSSTEESRSLAQEIADLKAAMKELVNERNRSNKEMEVERERKEREAEERLKKEEDDYREKTRDEVNQEKPGVMGFLMNMLPDIVQLALPGIVGKVAGVAGNAILKVFKK